MASILKRANKDGSFSYKTIISIKGFPVTIKTFHSEQEAKVWSKKMETSIRNKNFLPDFTLNDFIDRFIDDILPNKNPRYITREKIYLEFWKKSLGPRIINSLTSSEIENEANKLYEMITRNGKPYSPESRRKYLQTLGHIFNVAITHWKWATFNPVSGIDFHVDAIKSTREARKKNTNENWKDIKQDFIAFAKTALGLMGLPERVSAELSLRCGISKTTLQHIFDKNKNTSISALIKLANFLSIGIRFVNTKESKDCLSIPEHNNHSPDSEENPHQE